MTPVPNNIQYFIIGWGARSKITDNGFQEITTKVFPALLDLTIGMGAEHRITDSGLAQGMANMPVTRLLYFTIVLGGDSQVTDSGLEQTMLNLPVNIEVLTVDLGPNSQITDSGFDTALESIVLTLPNIRIFTIGMGMNSQVSDSQFRASMRKMPRICELFTIDYGRYQNKIVDPYIEHLTYTRQWHDRDV